MCVADGVFEATKSGVIFHPATGIDADCLAQVQAILRRRILRAFVDRGLLHNFDAKEMLVYQHSGCSVDAGVCIEAHDRAALKRRRCFARPPFAMGRLRKEGSVLVYRRAKQYSEPSSDKRGTKVDEFTLTLLELIERIAHLSAATAHARPSLLWCVGTEFTAQGYGDAAGRAGASCHGAHRACQCVRGPARAGASRPGGPAHASARAT
jgi:Putative transposase